MTTWRLIMLVGIALILTSCASTNWDHGDPVGADLIDGTWYCRDARGTRWLSLGRCD